MRHVLCNTQLVSTTGREWYWFYRFISVLLFARTRSSRTVSYNMTSTSKHRSIETPYGIQCERDTKKDVCPDQRHFALAWFCAFIKLIRVYRLHPRNMRYMMYNARRKAHKVHKRSNVKSREIMSYLMQFNIKLLQISDFILNYFNLICFIFTMSRTQNMHSHNRIIFRKLIHVHAQSLDYIEYSMFEVLRIYNVPL